MKTYKDAPNDLKGRIQYAACIAPAKGGIEAMEHLIVDLIRNRTAVAMKFAETEAEQERLIALCDAIIGGKSERNS